MHTSSVLDARCANSTCSTKKWQSVHALYDGSAPPAEAYVDMYCTFEQHVWVSFKGLVEHDIVDLFNCVTYNLDADPNCDDIMLCIALGATALPCWIC